MRHVILAIAALLLLPIAVFAQPAPVKPPDVDPRASALGQEVMECLNLKLDYRTQMIAQQRDLESLKAVAADEPLRLGKATTDALEKLKAENAAAIHQAVAKQKSDDDASTVKAITDAIAKAKADQKAADAAAPATPAPKAP